MTSKSWLNYLTILLLSCGLVAASTPNKPGNPILLEDRAEPITGIVIAKTAPARLYVDQNASGNNSGGSWENAITDLKIALDIAEEGTEIWVAEGTYEPVQNGETNGTFLIKDGVRLYGGFTGTETLLDQRNWIIHETILSGEINDNDILNDNVSHVVTTIGTSISTVLDGFTITGASSGGLFNDGGSPTLNNLIIKVNRTGINRNFPCGGGMINQDGNPSLTNIVFEANFSGTFGGNGGGFCNLGGSPILTNVLFYKNHVSALAGAIGGGMYSQGGNPILTNVTFYANYTEADLRLGGGLYVEDGNLVLNNCIFWNNVADQGAQIYSASTLPTIHYSLLQGSGGSGDSWDTTLGTDGGGNIDSDPQFVDTANGNLRPGPASPVIDAGDNSAVPSGLTSDLASMPRFVDINYIPDSGIGPAPVVDMGAYEVQPPEQQVFLPFGPKE